MEQIQIIQPTPSKAPPSSSGAQDVQNDFSPHLEAAVVNNNNQKVNTNEQESLKHPDVDNNGSESSSTAETLAVSGQESHESIDVDDETESSYSLTQFNYSTTFQLSQETSYPAGKTDQLRAFSDILFNFYNSENITTADSSTAKASDILQSLDKTIKQQLSQSQIDSAFQAALKQQTLQANNGQISGQMGSQEQDKILTQLQQIIDNSSEVGKVTVSQSANLSSSYAAKSNSAHPGSQTALQQQFMIDTDGETSSTSLTVSTYLSPDELNLNNAGNKQNQDLSGLRVDTKQQFYEAKLGEQSNSQNSSNNSEDKSSLNQFGQQPGTSGQLGATSANAEQPNTFAHVVGGTQGIDTQTAAETAKPIIPLAHNLAHEQEVLQQLIDKFQINIRKPETNLNIKLHPAELGELKIDLTVKEGSIRANVLAQSQHVQEILEKNMLKLKTVLEDQGFTVDEIIVASESESVGEFDLFDNHLFNRQNDTATPRQNTRTTTSGFQLEDTEQLETETISGVNVTA